MSINQSTGSMKHYIFPSSILEKIIFPEIERVINNIRKCMFNDNINEYDNGLFITTVSKILPEIVISEIGSKNWNELTNSDKEYQITKVVSFLEKEKEEYNFSLFLGSSLSSFVCEIIGEMSEKSQKYNSKYL